MRRTNWERFVPAELHDAEKAADPQNFWWLCGVCGERLRYTEHPAYPIHCEQRCRVLHHSQLDGHYVVSREATQAANEAFARGLEESAYRSYTWARERLEELVRTGYRRVRWSPLSRDLPLAHKRRISTENRERYEYEVAKAWTEVEQAAAECKRVAERAEWWRSPS